MGNIEIENLLISYLWRLIRETHSESDTKDGRTKLGLRETNISEQFDFLKSLIENLSSKLHNISPDKIDSYVHNQLSHFYGSSLKSSYIHNKLEEALVNTKIINNNLKIISGNFLSAYKEILYSFHFNKNKISIQSETFNKAKELCQEIGNSFFTNESPALFWNRKIMINLKAKILIITWHNMPVTARPEEEIRSCSYRLSGVDVSNLRNIA